MTRRQWFVVLVLLVAATARTGDGGADITGKWTASFDTQIGQQNYTYEFVVKDGVLTGKAKSENGESALQNGKVEGDTVTFVENLQFQGMDIRIDTRARSRPPTRSSSPVRSLISRPSNWSRNASNRPGGRTAIGGGSHSIRRAAIGSTRRARTAGARLARSATLPRMATATRKIRDRPASRRTVDRRRVVPAASPRRRRARSRSRPKRSLP